MIIQAEPLKHWIDNFFGYGSWDAKIWFIAHEESGGDLPEEEAEKFNYFHNVHAASTPSLCDIRDLYQHIASRLDSPRAHLFSTFYDYRFGPNAVQHGLWKNLIALAHGHRDQTLPDLMEYQKTTFLVPSANLEALIPLYPLPTHNHAWYYSWLDLPQFPYLKSRKKFQEFVYDSRMQTILENAKRFSPKLVLMYGMDNINGMKETIQEYFPTTTFKMMKAIKQQIPQHHVAFAGSTLFVITTQIPALRHNRIETGFDWETLGRNLRSLTA